MIKEWYRKGVSVSEIARRMGRDRKTVRKAILAPLEVKQSRRPRQRKIDAYVTYLEQRMTEGVYNARKLYTEIKAQGYLGGETQVRDYVQHRRPAKASQRATVRFETEPGQQAQVDWGHFGRVAFEGKQQSLYGFVMTLSWSRTMYVEFTTSMDSGWFLRCHQHAFEYFGGVPREMLHDNLKSAVLSRDADGKIHWNPRYLDFALVHGFTPRACQPYRAQTKGKVESGVRYVKVNFWPGIHIGDLNDLNQQARTWLNAVANPRIHATTNAMPFHRLAQENLQALPDLHYDTSIITSRRSSKDCLVSYLGNFYSVPAVYACQNLLVKETETGDLLIVNHLGEVIAQHRLLPGQRERSIDPLHYQSLTARSDSALSPILPFIELAPQVEVRPLSVYAAWVEEDRHE